MGDRPPVKVPARVIGPAGPGYLRVILRPDQDHPEGDTHTDVPVETIPFDLRLPNSEFMVLLEDGHVKKVIRIAF